MHACISIYKYTNIYLYVYINYIYIHISDGSNNRNRDAVVSTATATAVIFLNNRVYFKKFLFKKKFYFTYFEVRIVIMSLQLTIFFNRAKENLWFNLFLEFVILKFL